MVGVYCIRLAARRKHALCLHTALFTALGKRRPSDSFRTCPLAQSYCLTVAFSEIVGAVGMKHGSP